MGIEGTTVIELRRRNIQLTNQEGKTVWVDDPVSAIEILERFQDGKFNNSQYDVRRGPFEEKIIGPEDNLEITRVGYDNGKAVWDPYREYRDYSFEDYVGSGRRDTIFLTQIVS